MFLLEHIAAAQGVEVSKIADELGNYRLNRPPVYVQKTVEEREKEALEEERKQAKEFVDGMKALAARFAKRKSASETNSEVQVVSEKTEKDEARSGAEN